jgi:hypothetical protein
LLSLVAFCRRCLFESDNFRWFCRWRRGYFFSRFRGSLDYRCFGFFWRVVKKRIKLV